MFYCSLCFIVYWWFTSILVLPGSIICTVYKPTYIDVLPQLKNQLRQHSVFLTTYPRWLVLSPILRYPEFSYLLGNLAWRDVVNNFVNSLVHLSPHSLRVSAPVLPGLNTISHFSNLFAKDPKDSSRKEVSLRTHLYLSHSYSDGKSTRESACCPNRRLCFSSLLQRSIIGPGRTLLCH